MILRPSRWLTAVLIAAHGASAVTLVPLTLAVSAKFGLTLLIAASLVHAVRRHALLAGRGALTAIELREQDRAAVHTLARGWEEARILGTTYVSPLLTVVTCGCRAAFSRGTSSSCPTTWIRTPSGDCA